MAVLVVADAPGLQRWRTIHAHGWEDYSQNDPGEGVA